MTTTMTPADLDFVKRLATARGINLTEAGVRRGHTLGYAIDSVLAAADKVPTPVGIDPIKGATAPLFTGVGHG